MTGGRLIQVVVAGSTVNLSYWIFVRIKGKRFRIYNKVTRDPTQPRPQGLLQLSSASAYLTARTPGDKLGPYKNHVIHT